MFAWAALSLPVAAKPVWISAVRNYSTAELTTITIELDGVVAVHRVKIEDPLRVVLDVPSARLKLEGRGTRIFPIGDGLVRQIRVAQYNPSAARLVLDLEHDATIEYAVHKKPATLTIGIRLKALPLTPANTLTSAHASPDEPAPAKKPAIGVEDSRATAAKNSEGIDKPEHIAALNAPKDPDGARSLPSELPRNTPKSAIDSGPRALPATANSSGDRSLTRALGLKLGKVVIDAGHGGHDEGTRGPTGLLEKDLALDVALRLGALIEQRLGAEVVYTRSTDVFVPLEERTAIANRAEADLFLSIHANSSPLRGVSGSEAYYLGLRGSKESMDVAGRENEWSGKSIHDLDNVLKKIALNEKVVESTEFATRVQRELYSTWYKMSGATRNRGVKKAPFVVLIGAHMPSVLAEIGFVTNPHDEALLKRADQRQRIAEALFRGVNAYASTLSRLDTARASAH